MAERNSTKTGSRRTTPQPVVESTRTTRTTRSQSHEVSDHESTRNVPKGRRGAKKASSDSAESAARPTKARRGRPPQDQPDLPTVNEDPSVVINPATGGEDEPDQPTLNRKSPSGASAFSGTTARTSRSAQELTDPSFTDGMVLDTLPDFWRDSEALLDFLLPTQISSNIVAGLRLQFQNKRSPVWGQLARLRAVFHIQFTSCNPHDTSETFASALKAIPTLAGIPNSSWRPDSVYHAANLAILASNALLDPQQEDKQFLERVETSFPKAFITNFSAAQSATTFESTLQLAIELRTQYAITALATYLDRPNFDADDVLQQIFFEADGTPKGWDFAGLRSGETSKEPEDSITQRLQEIRSITDRMEGTMESRASSMEHLRALYSWDEAAAAILTWINDRKEEIKAELPEPQVIQDLVSALKDEVIRTKEAKGPSGDGHVVLDFDPPSEPSNSTVQGRDNLIRTSARSKELRSERFNANSPKHRQALKLLKDRAAKAKLSKAAQEASREQVRSAETDVQIAPRAGHAVRAATPEPGSKAQQVPSSAPAKTRDDREPIGDEDDWQPQHGDDDDDDDFQTQTIQADRVLELRAQRDAESNKENQAESSQAQEKRSLYDRQAGAQKVAWNENSNSQESDALEVSQDEGFQGPRHRTSMAQRALQPIRKRNASEPITTQGPSPAKRARFADRPSRNGEGADDDDAQGPQAPPRPSQSYYIANSAARQMSAMQPKRVQTRTPWSQEECDRLLELIATLGTSWSSIKNEDIGLDILHQRDQVALKDKARNMKVTYLKSGRYLPKNFEKIALSKIQIQQLRNFDIPYDPETGEREDEHLLDEE